MTPPSFGAAHDRAATSNGASAPAAAVEVPRPLPPSRRRGMVLGGLLLVLACGTVGAVLFTAAGHRTSVVVITRHVPAGQRLAAADMATTMVAADPGVATVPASRRRDMIGLVAATDLLPGTLLSPAQATTAMTPVHGQMLVSIPCRAGQLPADGLRPGDQTVLIPTPGGQGQDSDTAPNASAPLTQLAPATVEAVGSPDTEGNITVTVLVTSDLGPKIVQQASLGRIGLGITARRSAR